MLNDDQDKDMARRQTIALVVMLLLLWGWFTYFAPKPKPAAPQQATTSTAANTTAGTAAAPAADAAPTAAGETESAWPFLPPVPAEPSPDDEVIIRDNDLELVFTKIGARLKRASVLLGENGDESIQLVPQAAAATPDTQVMYPLGLRFTDPELGQQLDARRFDAIPDGDSRGITFNLDLPGAARVQKRFRLSTDRHVVEVHVEYQNLEAAPRRLGLDQTPAYMLTWGPGLVVQHEGNQFPPTLVWRRDAATQIFKTAELPVGADGKPQDKRVPSVDWIGYKSKYFMVALKPAGDGAMTNDAWINGLPQAFQFGLSQPSMTLAPSETSRTDYRLYLGPMHLGELQEAWPTLSTALRFFPPGGWFGDTVSDLMDWFAKQLLRNLNWWHSFIPNYGVAIILLTVLVRMVVFPLTIKSMRSMKKMQALQPEMQAIKEKYKDNPQEFQKQMMLIYRERKINPLAGCLPLLLQMPVFIALYRMLWNTFEIRGADFLWVKDLSQPDSLFQISFLRGLPFFGDALSHFNILPILIGGSMLISMKLTPTSGPMQSPEQKMVMNLMPIIFAAFSYPFAAGLNLYVLTSTVLGIAQNWLVRHTRIGGPPIAPLVPVLADGPEDGNGKKPQPEKVAAPVVRRKKPQHFYDRAQQRKREMARAEKKNRKKK